MLSSTFADRIQARAIRAAARCSPTGDDDNDLYSIIGVIEKGA